jgi:hypothetical protein
MWFSSACTQTKTINPGEIFQDLDAGSSSYQLNKNLKGRAQASALKKKKSSNDDIV